MSLEAKKLALTLASEKDLRHSLPSERPNQGESLAMGCTTASGPGISAAEAIKKWYLNMYLFCICSVSNEY